MPVRGALSAAQTGRGLLVNAIVSPGDLLHLSGAVGLPGADREGDWLTIWAVNRDTVTRRLTIQWGDLADLIPKDLSPGTGLIQVTPSLPLEAGLEVRCFASVSNQILVIGHRLKPPL